MDKKLDVIMETLQGYCSDNRAVQCREEDFQLIRGHVQKLTGLLNSNEQKAKFFANESYLQTIVYALQVLPDRYVRVHTIRLLFRLVYKSAFKKYALSLVQRGVTRAACQALYLESTEPSPNEEFLIRIHQLLCRIGPLDKRLGVRARVNQCLQITLAVLRSQVALLSTFTPASVTTLPSGSATSGPNNGALYVPSITVNHGSTSTYATASSSVSTTPSCNTTSTFNTSFAAAGGSLGTQTAMIISIPRALNRNISTILRALRLYVVKGLGKTNASILGRAGVIPLLIRLLAIVSGLPFPKLYPGRSSPTPPAPKGQSASTGHSGSGQVNSLNGVGNLAVTCTGSPNRSTSVCSSVPGAARNLTENGLVIGSPVIAAITATASAAAALHRHRFQHTARVIGKPTGGQPNGTHYLASSATSLLSTMPTLIAVGVRYHSKLLRSILNTFLCLVKWKQNVVRAIDAGGIAILLDLFLDVHRCDLHARRLPLQRCLLACLKCLTTLRAGRKLLISCGGLHAMFAVCAGYVGPDPLGRTDLHDQVSSDLSMSSFGSRNSTSGARLSGRSPSPLSKTDSSISSLGVASTTEHDLVVPASVNVGGLHDSHCPPVCPLTSHNPSSPLSVQTSMLAKTTLSHSAGVKSDLCTTAGDSTSTSIKDNSFLNVPDNMQELVTILMEACMLLRRCCPRNRLPVTSTAGLLRCPLPHDSVTRPTGDGCPQQDAQPLADADRSTLVDACPTDGGTTPPTVAVLKRDEKRTYRNNPRPRATEKSRRLHTFVVNDTCSNKSLRICPAGKSLRRNSDEYSKDRGTIRRSLARRRATGQPRSTGGSLRSSKSHRTRRNRTNTHNFPSHPGGSTTRLTMTEGNFVESYSNDAHCGPQLAGVVSVKRLPAYQTDDAASDDGSDELRLNSASSVDPHEHAQPDRVSPLSEADVASVQSEPRSPPFLLPHAPAVGVPLDEPSSMNRASSVTVLQDVDDDDGDDDFDEDEEIGATSEASRQALDPQIVLPDLIGTHGRFFPEWIDLPRLLPNSVDCDQLELAADASVQWSLYGDQCSAASETNESSSDPDRNSLSAHQLARFTSQYLNQTQYTQGLAPFQTIAYPDLIGATGSPHNEPFYIHPTLGSRRTSSSKPDESDKNDPLEKSTGTQLLQVPSKQKYSSTLDSIRLSVSTISSSDSNKCSGQSSEVSTSSKQTSGRTEGSHKRNTGRPPPRLPYSLRGLRHAEILDDIRRLVDPDDLINRTVYDLDGMILNDVREAQNAERTSRSASPRLLHVPAVNTRPSPPPATCSLLGLATTDSVTCSIQPSPAPAQCAVDNINSVCSEPSLPPNVTRNSATECSGYGDCCLLNEDEMNINRFDVDKGHLEFESRFESGNLRKAIQVRLYEYDLILNPDVNTVSNLQWFYFRVSNVEADVDYRFNVINCEKPGSQYTSGMQPLLFSVREALDGRPYWRRAGKCIGYYRNHFARSFKGRHSSDGNTYFTTTFTLRFPHTGDVCYIAYHYPYTYTRLLTDLCYWQELSERSTAVYFNVQTLTHSVLANPVPVITITERMGLRSPELQAVSASASDQSDSDQSATVDRPYIFLTARVHSGESNSSWVMQGLIERLLSDDPNMSKLRSSFVFKIVPMLNPDGVVCGNHRCSMSGKDLNRRWIHPSPDIHPTIYHTKKLLHLLYVCGRQPYVFVDLHGHSRMKNIFLYGCSPLESWKSPDLRNPTYRAESGPSEDRSYRYLADVLDSVAPAFSKKSCMYVVNKSKETTARVAVWREFRVIRSYTIEASYCGVTRSLSTQTAQSSVDSSFFDEQGHQLNPAHLRDFGSHLLVAFQKLPEYDRLHPSIISPRQSDTLSENTALEISQRNVGAENVIISLLRPADGGQMDVRILHEDEDSCSESITSLSSSVSVSSSFSSSCSSHSSTLEALTVG